MFPGTLENSSHVPQIHWGTGTVPQVPQKVCGEQEQFPNLLKSIWGTGIVPEVPQKVFGEQEKFPKFLKSVLGNILGNFGEQASHKLAIKC